jgi:hypothetical protein
LPARRLIIAGIAGEPSLVTAITIHEVNFEAARMIPIAHKDNLFAIG